MNYDKLRACKLFLLDMDGTLYLGDEVFPGAHGFIARLAETGRKYIYLTNNSSRAGEDYIARLRRLGFPCEAENVFTSGMATGMYLNTRYRGKKTYVVGTPAFENELERYGVPLTRDDDAEVVCAGFDTTLTYEKLDRAVHFLRRGAAFVAANPDWVCPMPAGEVMPDCGSICALLTAASGSRPFYIGKPNRSMVDIISEMTGVPNERICCVGDRLYTDIAVASNSGAVSVLVMSGETTPDMLAGSETRPDYVLADVAELSELLAPDFAGKGRQMRQFPDLEANIFPA